MLLLSILTSCSIASDACGSAALQQSSSKESVEACKFCNTTWVSSTPDSVSLTFYDTSDNAVIINTSNSNGVLGRCLVHNSTVYFFGSGSSEYVISIGGRKSTYVVDSSMAVNDTTMVLTLLHNGSVMFYELHFKGRLSTNATVGCKSKEHISKWQSSCRWHFLTYS